MYTTVDTVKEKERAYQSLLQYNASHTSGRGFGIKLEMRIFDALTTLRDQGVADAHAGGRIYHTDGLGLILGYDPSLHTQPSHNYFDIPKAGKDGAGKDVFAGINPHPSVFAENVTVSLTDAMKRDGVVLISTDGQLLHSGTYIDFCVRDIFQCHPYGAATYQLINTNLRADGDNGVDAGTRHKNSVALSCVLPDVLIYILKSDKPQIRIIAGGHVVHSTDPRDVNHPSSLSIACLVPLLSPPLGVAPAPSLACVAASYQ